MMKLVTVRVTIDKERMITKSTLISSVLPKHKPVPTIGYIGKAPDIVAIPEAFNEAIDLCHAALLKSDVLGVVPSEEVIMNILNERLGVHVGRRGLLRNTYADSSQVTGLNDCCRAIRQLMLDGRDTK